MEVKIWRVIQGPISVEESGEDAPEGANWFMVCQAEVDGVLGEDNFWFEEFDDAYEWETHFKKSIEPIVIDMGNGPEYNQGFAVKFEIHITLEVDPDANFLETYGDNTDVISELIQDSIYDIDDVKILDCEVKNDQ